MKPVDQTIFEPGLGNCFAACVASVLELPLTEVPNFCAVDAGDWFQSFTNWLRPRGFWAIACPIGGSPGNPDGGWYPEGLHIAGGKSPRYECLHAVVARGAEVVHDPHPSRAGVVNFADTTVIIPIDPCARGPASCGGDNVRELRLQLKDGDDIPNGADDMIEITKVMCPSLSDIEAERVAVRLVEVLADMDVASFVTALRAEFPTARIVDADGAEL